MATEATTDVQKTEGSNVASAPEQTRTGPVYSPAVDIFENDNSITLLADDSEVVHISPDRKVKGLLDLTADAVNASTAWVSGWTGKGITVAVIDSGISNHPDLDNRIVYKQDFVGGGTDDRFGHGEHVAGISPQCQ